MYGKIFKSMFEGSLRGHADELLVFTNLIVSADLEGYADRSHKTIADETGLTMERVRTAIDHLESPDTASRTPDMAGKRLERIDAHRDWGWRIVNYRYYRDLNTAEKRRNDTRERVKRHRESKLKKKNVTTVTPASAYTSSSTPEGMQGEVVSAPWTRQQFDAAAANVGTEAIAVADALWAHLDTQGWQWGNGMRVQGDPRSAFTRWLSKSERQLKPDKAGGNGHRDAWKVEADIAALKAEIRKTTGRIDAKRQSGTDSEWIRDWRKFADPSDVTKRDQQRARLKELETELQGAL